MNDLVLFLDTGIAKIAIRVICISFVAGGMSYAIRKQADSLGFYKSAKHRARIHFWSDTIGYIVNILMSILMTVFYDYLHKGGGSREELYLVIIEGFFYGCGSIGLQLAIMSDWIPKTIGLIIGGISKVYRTFKKN